MIDLSFFRNARPAVEPHLLDAGDGASATNCRYESGALRPFKGNAMVKAVALAQTPKTIYRYTDAFWFEFSGDVDVTPAPLATDTENTVYYTGTDKPRVTDATIATSGSEPYPTVSRSLGVPYPENPFTVLVSGVADPDDNVGEFWRYVVTFVNSRGQEGPPSSPSSEVQVYNNQSVNLSDLPVAPVGDWDITNKRIYRRSSASGDGAYLFLAELDIATTTYADTTLTENLGEVIESTDWYAPPDDMVGLTALANGVLAGFRENELCLSEAFVPSAWPPGYRIPTEDKIVAIAGITGGCVVATEGQPYVVQFTLPASAAYDRIETPRGCLSKRSMVDMGDWAVYAAGDGLVAIDGSGQAPVITESILTPDQWRALDPTSMHAYRLDDRYVCFYDNGSEQGGFVITPQGGKFSWIGFWADAGYTDPSTGNLYLVVSGNIVQWDKDAGSPQTYEFRSGDTLTPRLTNPAFARVDAESYPASADNSLVLKLYADGVLRHTQQVTSEEMFPLPADYLARRFSIELSGTRTVRRALLVEDPERMT